MNFLHLIVTCYNINQPDIGWLTSRLRLFERFTVPSVLQQTCQNFIWVVLMDRRTPKDYLMRLYTLTDFASNIIFPLLKVNTKEYHKLDSASLPLPIAKKFINDFAAIDHIDSVITTCLDNDDAISINFVEEVQEYVRSHPKQKDQKYLLDVPESYFVSANLSKISVVNNRAITHASVSPTIVEPGNTELATSYFCMHGVLPNHVDSYNFINASNIHTIHGTNASGKASIIWSRYRPTVTMNWKKRFKSHFPYLEGVV